MVCSDFAVLRETILRNCIFRKTKEYLRTYLQTLFPQLTLNPPPVQKHSGPEKISRKYIYISIKDKNFLAPLNLQFREHMYTQDKS